MHQLLLVVLHKLKYVLLQKRLVLKLKLHEELHKRKLLLKLILLVQELTNI